MMLFVFDVFFQQLGMRELESGAVFDLTLRAPMCSTVLLAWHLVGVYVLGTGDGDIKLCERLLNTLLTKYPKVSNFSIYSCVNIRLTNPASTIYYYRVLSPCTSRAACA